MNTITRNIHRLDASGQILGRLATEVANLLRGKYKVGFTNYQDHGDSVVISNAKNIVVTGNKLDGKIYYRHSAYPGALKSKPLREMLATKPDRVIMLAVMRMLPDNRLRSQWLRRLSFKNDG